MKRTIFCLYLMAICFAMNAQQRLSLDDCRQLAIENNKQLKISNENIKKAQSEKKAARAQFFPDISFTGAYLYNQKSISILDSDRFLPIGTLMADGSFGFTPEQINNQWLDLQGTRVPLDSEGKPFNPSLNPEKIMWKEYTTIPKSEFELDLHHVFVGTLSLTQPLFMGGKITAYNRITEYAEQLAEVSKEATVQDIILQTEQAYWQTISLESKQTLSDNYVSMLKQMDHDVQALIEEGISTKADGLTVKVKLNEAEMTKMQVDNGLQLSKMLLCQLCGLPLEEEIILTEGEMETIPAYQQDLFQGIDYAYAHRPELKSLDLASRIYKKKESIAKAEMLPTLALTGNYLVTNPNSYNGFKNEFGGMWNVGVMLKVPIFHFGERTNKLRAARSETRIRQFEMEEAREKIELQINQSLFKVTEAEKKQLVSEKNLTSAEENLRYANLGFKEGVIPVSNVMEAQTAWFKAQSDYIDSQIELRLSQLQLSKASGTMNINN